MNLYLRGKSWYYDFLYRGERYRGCIGPVPKATARAIVAKKKAEAVGGRYELPSQKPSPRLDEFVTEYLAYYAANRRPRSLKRHEVSYRSMQGTFGPHRLADIGPLDIERYKRQRQGAGVAPATINRELAFLKNLYTKAVEWGKATENPVKKVRLYREDKARTRFLTDDEEARLLATCGRQLTPLVVTALNTGFRRSELLSLTWNDVDFERGRITVRAGYSKNGEARSVPMNHTLTAVLKSARVSAASERVFCTRRGQPYRSFRTAFERAVRKAGITDFTFHDLRHTFARRLVMARVDLPTVKELLGHKDISMTMRYAHLSADHKRLAVQRLEQFGAKVTTESTTPGSVPTWDKPRALDGSRMGR